MAKSDLLLETSVVPATLELAGRMVGRLREADNREALAASGHSADWGLIQGVKHSERCWVGMHGDEPVACFGVRRTSVLSDTGIPWLLATDGILNVKREFVQQSKVYVEKMMEGFALLENWVDMRNEVSIRWLRWCGFTIAGMPQRYGVERQPFFHFWMRRN